ncbi:MAG: protein kinase [Candidatus Brocadiae bacterium]|nr:protein kinase [Candidatus Brocadiia bacterium]
MLQEEKLEQKQNFDLLPGTVLGKCKIEAMLGRGGMGTVYRAYHELLQTQVAIKILHNASAESLKSFFEEAQSIAKLEHPNIMKIYDIEHHEESGKHYIVTQLIAGKALDSMLSEQGSFHVLEALKIVMDATKGLIYAHQKGIIHRDIKPANIMLDDHGNGKLTDFGLACSLDSSNANVAKIVGTPHYMAPEQWSNEAMDQRTDIYALGGTFYHLLAGCPPFKGDYSVVELLKKHLSENPCPLEQIVPDVPTSIVLCIRKMMAKLPGDRFQNCEELLVHLEEIYSSLKTIPCPRCGRENTKEHVFHCPRCKTQNLCLNHLLAHKHYCDHCEEMVTEAEEQSLLQELQQWLETLTKILIGKDDGILHIQESGENSLLFNLFPDMVELKTRDLNYEGVLTRYNIPLEMDRNTADKSVFAIKIAEALGWNIQKMKFYATKQDNMTRSFPLLPPHPANFVIQDNAKNFLKHFISLVRLYKSTFVPGGLMVKRSNKTVGVLFTRSGVAITQQQDENSPQEFIQDEEAAIDALKEALQRDCSQIIYREAIAFPPIHAEALFALPEKMDLERLISQGNWEQFQSYIPDLTALIPNAKTPSLNFKWSELQARQIHHRLTSMMRWKEWFELPGMETISVFHRILIMVAVIKELIRDVANVLLENARLYITTTNKMDKSCELILKSAEGMSPDNLELLKLMTRGATTPNRREQAAEYFTKLGDLYLQRDQTNKATAYYRCALEYSTKAEMAKLGLLEIAYRNGEYKEVEKLGVDLIPLLKANGTQGQSNLKKVCELLLTVDKGLVECRKELTDIYVQEGNTIKAISEFEALADFYQQIGKEEQSMQYYMRILELSPDREDLKQKVKAYQDKGKKILESIILEKISKKLCAAIGVIFILSLLLWQAFQDWHSYLCIHFLEKDISLENLQEKETMASWLSDRFALFVPNLKERSDFVLQQLKRAKRQRENERNQTLQKWQKRVELIKAIVKGYENSKNFLAAIDFCENIRKEIYDKEYQKKIELLEKEIKQKNRIQSENKNP